MGWHVHFKKGKYAIWSTIIDGYITKWTDEETIKEVFKEDAVERALILAKSSIERAKNEGCSAFNPFKCDLDHLRIKNGK